MISSSIPRHSNNAEYWPALPYEDWKETCTTLHMWTQIVGKIRRVQTPWINHSWHVALYLTARGMTTSPIPYRNRTFQIDFDFIEHRLLIQTSDAMTRVMRLEPRSVADFYREFFSQLSSLGLDIKIYPVPNEVINAIPFEQDTLHASYDAEYVNRFWCALLQADRVFKQFRSGFVGKSSPVHFFWGSFDLAVTRFSGHTAPEHPGGIPNCPDWVMREAYSHEVSSCGFWPGNEAMPYPAFYAYAYPAPQGYGTRRVRPDSASYNTAFGEFILAYDDVRQTDSPDATLLAFLQDTYEAAADLSAWDRAALERTAFPVR
ncbi:MAG TPA: DUF5996 family protein [Burkholderiaceae bacterium]